MAGDWIPIEESMPRKPEVMRIVAQVSRSRHEVVGLLVEFWLWASANTTDGVINIPLSALPQLIGADDVFWRAVVGAGWLEEEDGNSIRIPNGERWLCNGAKSRLENTRRQQNHRVAQMSRKTRDKSATTVQKSTEEKSTEEQTREDSSASPKNASDTEPLFTEGEPKPTATRQPDIVWDFVVQRFGLPTDTKAQRSRVGKAVKAFRLLRSDPPEIGDRERCTDIDNTYRSYVEAWGDRCGAPSPEALVKHWGKFFDG